MPQNTQPFALGTINGQQTVVRFDATHTTSDAGVVLLSRIDARLKLCERLAGAIADQRNPLLVTHLLVTLLRQRIFQIAMGWEDCDDGDLLRSDPALKLACDRQPASNEPLASQPTLSRLENAVTDADLARLSDVLLDQYLERQPRRRRLIVIDADVTDAETHGHQELSAFNTYYGHTCLTPLLVFDGTTGDLLSVAMRPGNASTGDGLVEQLGRIVPRLRQRWPGARILVRLDSGFDWPSIFDFCETNGLEYLIAMKNNKVLERMAATSMRDARYLADQSGEQRQVFGYGTYQSRSWSHVRRVVWKAEAGPYATDQRYVITNLLGVPSQLYRRYSQRGQSENWIKGFKRALKGNRMSCHKASANQFRLLLHAAAYALMLALQENLTETEAACWQFDTLRIRLLKVGGWIHQAGRRTILHLAASHPHQDLWACLIRRLQPA
ncbi:MAG: IS1380 family transposase [Candidatus Sericytochromatia bacterium]|nr:IS1380 family transposase [Candidatus Sericytochromatia bacterium]